LYHDARICEHQVFRHTWHVSYFTIVPRSLWHLWALVNVIVNVEVNIAVFMNGWELHKYVSVLYLLKGCACCSSS